MIVRIPKDLEEWIKKVQRDMQERCCMTEPLPVAYLAVEMLRRGLADMEKLSR
jgi:hypothetical protein